MSMTLKQVFKLWHFHCQTSCLFSHFYLSHYCHRHRMKTATGARLIWDVLEPSLSALIKGRNSLSSIFAAVLLLGDTWSTFLAETHQDHKVRVEETWGAEPSCGSRSWPHCIGRLPTLGDSCSKYFPPWTSETAHALVLRCSCLVSCSAPPPSCPPFKSGCSSLPPLHTPPGILNSFPSPSVITHLPTLTWIFPDSLHRQLVMHLSHCQTPLWSQPIAVPSSSGPKLSSPTCISILFKLAKVAQ